VDEALSRIRSDERRPDLVVLDLNMAAMSGWEFLAARKKDPVLLLTPVLIMSTEAEVPPGISSEMFLQKPFGFERFLQTVGRVLEWSSPDPERFPRASEPWTVDDQDPRVVKNAFGQAVAFAASEREARRLVAAVNGVTRISTEALEQGLVDKGLECLYELNRYETDDLFRTEIDGHRGLESIQIRRREIAAALESAGLGSGGSRGA
jgi:DNA-binding response OmpR family regulator